MNILFFLTSSCFRKPIHTNLYVYYNSLTLSSSKNRTSHILCSSNTFKMNWKQSTLPPYKMDTPFRNFHRRHFHQKLNHVMFYRVSIIILSPTIYLLVQLHHILHPSSLPMSSTKFLTIITLLPTTNILTDP